jgi:hypothetical protein
VPSRGASGVTQSKHWRRESARLLERELINNTFASGIGRELASDYQCFVTELGLLAAVEADGSDRPLAATAWDRLCAMVDSCAALVDERGVIQIPDLYRDVRPLSDVERGRLARLPFDESLFRSQAGIARGAELAGEPDFSPFERLWLRPSLAITALDAARAPRTG